VLKILLIAEGIALAAYSFTTYRGASKESQKAPLASATLISQWAKQGDSDELLKRSELLAKYVHLVRDLVNTPANYSLLLGLSPR
jgi:leucyl aminopeptidase